MSPASADMTSTKQAWCKRPVGKDHDAAERWLSLALVEIARLTAPRRLSLTALAPLAMDDIVNRAALNGHGTAVRDS